MLPPRGDLRRLDSRVKTEAGSRSSNGGKAQAMKSRTFAGWLLAGGLTTLLCAACSSQGDAGQGCVYSGGLLNGSYSCNRGLVCNTGRSSPTCESPNANAVGGPCGEDNNCKAGLWCNLKVCTDLIGLGQPCPSGVGCASGLICSKMVDPNRPVCAVDDGGAPPGDGGGSVADATGE
jgi:hypothetical protein